MKFKFKVGDLVKCVEIHHLYQNLTNKLGKIIYIDNLSPCYLIEFFEQVNKGHSYCEKEIGKQGYCQWLEEANIKLYKPLLKLFLKEKKRKLNEFR